MTKKIFYTILFALIMLYSCEQSEIIYPEGEIKIEHIPTKAFTGISISSAFIVEVEMGFTDSVLLETQENILPYIQVYVSGGVLFIEPKEFVNFGRGTTLKAKIIVKELNYAQASGASIINISGLTESDRFEVALSGASQLTANIWANELYANTSGASELDLEGNIESVYLESSGASKLISYEFYCNYFDANISGAGEAKLTINEELNITASGASIIRYKGNGTIKKVELSGGSEIIHL
jgi:hypothetical protein